MGGILGSGVAFPLGVDARGGVALAHEDQDVQQAIQIILGTAPGERPMRPEFGCGIHDFVFESVDADMLGRLDAAIRDALDHWEPRIEVLDVTFDLRPAGTAQGAADVLMIDIAYRLRETNALRNLVYPFYVVPAEEP
jgi:phage baseplate assembly protein W